ncbi:hypothetical protein ACFXJ5_36970 [Streptomyces sp. NPDC059373]
MATRLARRQPGAHRTGSEQQPARQAQDGAQWRARQLGFTSGGKAYQLNIWYAAQVRAAALQNYADVTESFEPL